MPLAKPWIARIPWVTVAVVVAGVAATIFPEAAERLQYDRHAVDSGAWWRPIGGQLAHWTPRMAMADLLVVALAGGWLEAHSRRLLSWTLGTATVLTGLTVHFWLTGIAFYRGSSGIATALLVGAVPGLVRTLPRRALLLPVIAGLVLLVAKIAWESASGRALFAGDLPAGVSVLPEVHLAGAMAGIACVAFSAILGGRRRRGLQETEPLH